jgi:iron complex outermembrane receptor protein
MSVSAAVFQIKQGLEYENADTIPTYVRNGEEVHRGLELGAQGNAGKSLSYSVSLMAIKMLQEGTGDVSLDGKRPPNIPAFKSTSVFEYAVPAVAGLKMTGVWQYSGKKAFDNENTVFVPGYHLFGLGTAYAIKVGGLNTTIRANIDNVTDKFYWRDVSPLLGGYLLPGAPRTARLSAQFDF